MKKLGIALLIGNIVAAQGCKDITFIADALPNDTLVVPDTAVDSDTVTIPADTQTGLDMTTDSDTVTVNCDGLSANPGDSERTIDVGGNGRTYVLHIPNAYTGVTPAPLIVDYHAINGSGAEERTSSPYPAVTDPEGVVMAFPNGLTGPLGTAWNLGPCCVDNVDDVAFARAMVLDIAATACIDPSRIYAVGISMGGGMAHHLACEAADIFAAVAPSAFDLVEENVPGCTPPRPIAVLSFRGTADPLVPYDGGYSNVVPGHPVTFLGAVGTFEQWAKINGCTGIASDDGNGCQTYAATQCTGGVEVTLCTEQGGGIKHGDVSIAWPFLKRHLMP